MKTKLFMLFLMLTQLALGVPVTTYWTGGAQAVAQIDTFTPALVDIGDTFTLTVTGTDETTHAVVFTATAATVANVTAGLTALWNAETNAKCTPVTAANGTTVLTLTADTAGTAFSVASTSTGGTLTRAATLANTGPKNWDNIANWSTGALPLVTDNVYIENWSGDILYGLTQDIVFGSLNISQTFTGNIGSNGATGKDGTYLVCHATLLNIGYNYSGATANGSGRIMINLGDQASTVTIYNTAAAGTDTGKPCVRLLLNEATSDIYVYQGKVGVGIEQGEVCLMDNINIGYATTATAINTEVTIGSGVVLDDVTKRIAKLTLNCHADSLTNESGSTYTYGSGTIPTMTINGGTVYSNSTGTITTANVNGGTLELTETNTAREVTSTKLGDGGTIRYDPSVITTAITLTETSGKFSLTSTGL